jgi:hypothetical protein
MLGPISLDAEIFYFVSWLVVKKYRCRLCGGMQCYPFLQAGGCAESLRVYFPETVHPVEGSAFQRAVHADALMRFSRDIWYFFSEPQDGTVSAFFHIDEPAGTSNGLEFLKGVHASTIDRLRCGGGKFKRFFH